VWTSLGAHAEHGLWAILGARHGCWKTNCTDWDYTEVRDFDKLAEIFKEVSTADVAERIEWYGKELAKNYKLYTNCIDSETSKFVVEMFQSQYQQAVEQVTWVMRRNNV
jgi:hypothetical protein